ncbi:hypothetical protein [Burkholderia vietnamiensis]|uniref:hypothetical protein n=1 Tax=Burkholderia vietnamiensis TaxID=60552 RepID=UPI001BA0D441|nr:hypothetical protein [Burkholderia vietnamiensis]MBR8201704.1 hypothetical protein [Burkholderia vietnamiensis]
MEVGLGRHADRWSDRDDVGRTPVRARTNELGPPLERRASLPFPNIADHAIARVIAALTAIPSSGIPV